MKLMLIRAFWFTLGVLMAWVYQEVRYAPVLPEVKLNDKKEDEEC